MITDDTAVQKHAFPRKLKEWRLNPCRLHEGVRDLDEWIKRVVAFAKKNEVDGYTLRQIEGDAFEHLVQCIIERHGHDAEEVDCVEIGSTPGGYPGIDLIGKTHAGKVHAHQCKFNRNSRHKLSMDEIDAFHKAEIDFDPGSRKTLWTTANGVNPQVAKNLQGLVDIRSIDWLRANLDGDEGFWDGHYARSLGATLERRVGLIDSGGLDYTEPDRTYQLDALARFKQEVAGNPRDLKGRYIYPTGAGKTLIESLILHHQMERIEGFSLHVVVAPRIALLTQLMRQCREFIGDKYEQIGFHSNNYDEGVDYDRDLNLPTQRKTTEIKKVELEISRARRDGVPLLIFSTYHSLHKLVKAGLSFETMIADESQYCISRDFFQSIQTLAAKAKLYFTATERRAATGERRNDNVEAFGEVFHEEAIQVLVARNILAKPKLHLLIGNSSFDDPSIVGIDKVEEDAVVRHLVDLAGHIAEEQRRLVNDALPAKTLFACKNAKHIKTIVEERNLEKLNDRLKEIDPDRGHSIFTISSETGAKIDGVRLSKGRFLQRLAEHQGNALVFHFDILSEGIDVDGITGVAMLRSMQHAKALQTIGRCLRPYKANTSLKPHAYVSVPVINGNVRQSDLVDNTIIQMLTGGLEVNHEEIEVRLIDRDPPLPEGSGLPPRGPKPDGEQPGLDLRQEVLRDVEHRLKEVTQNDVKEMVENVDRNLREEEQNFMLMQEVTDDFIDDLLSGLYQPGGKPLNEGLASCRSRNSIIEKAWADSRKRIRESGARPATPLRMVETHLNRVGDISGKSALTFNVEYVPQLKEQGANVMLATREVCEATRNLAESQIIEAEYLTLETVMNKGLKFDIVIGNPPYQEKVGPAKTEEIWPDFVVDGLDLLVEGGRLAMIHPPAWRGGGGNEIVNRTCPKGA